MPSPGRGTGFLDLSLTRLGRTKDILAFYKERHVLVREDQDNTLVFSVQHKGRLRDLTDSECIQRDSEVIATSLRKFIRSDDDDDDDYDYQTDWRHFLSCLCDRPRALTTPPSRSVKVMGVSQPEEAFEVKKSVLDVMTRCLPPTTEKETLGLVTYMLALAAYVFVQDEAPCMYEGSLAHALLCFLVDFGEKKQLTGKEFRKAFIGNFACLAPIFGQTLYNIMPKRSEKKKDVINRFNNIHVRSVRE